MNFLNDPKIISKTPILSIGLMQISNLFQMYKIWSEKSADGQSLVGWILVEIALFIWLHFYYICCPKETTAIFSNYLAIIINFLVILSIIKFQIK